MQETRGDNGVKRSRNRKSVTFSSSLLSIVTFRLLLGYNGTSCHDGGAAAGGATAKASSAREAAERLTVRVAEARRRRNGFSVT